MFYEILDDGFRVKPENEIFEKFRKMINISRIFNYDKEN